MLVKVYVDVRHEFGLDCDAFWSKAYEKLHIPQMPILFDIQ